jgi:hypothetical protein
MKAQVGDRLVMESTHVGEARRTGVVIELQHADGTPPYRVRWLSDNHESIVFPGSDARVEPPSDDDPAPAPPAGTPDAGS